MPYILNKTNGNVLTVVQDGDVDNTTSLLFVGKNFSGYGEIINENTLKLLENFSNSTPPSKPIQGQLWFDNNRLNYRLNICYDGKNFKGISNIFVQSNDPSASATSGDLWWDTDIGQLKIYDGSSQVIIGPPIAKNSNSSIEFTKGSDGVTDSPLIEHRINLNTVSIVSNLGFTLLNTSPLYRAFPYISKGITLAGADPITGISANNGYYFWGSAAHALSANTSTSLNVTNTTTGIYNVPFIGTITGKTYSTSSFTYNVSTQVLNATATSAYYADLAERYESDKPYEVGTVLVIGGEKEVTTTNTRANTAVIGIVSKNPAYMMNSGAGTDETHPFIALKGRVPCQVQGRIEKGNLLVTSIHPGYATAWTEGDSPNAVIGKALFSQEKGYGIIEVLVV
jgi:hypothetical protein